MQVRVYYEDTDIGGIVYHANYLKFCERARSECFFQVGLTPQLDGGEFVAASLEATYKASAKLGDMLDVTTQILSLKRSSLLLRHCVLKDGVILFDMNIKLGFIQSGKIGRMSQDTQALVSKLFSKDLE